MGNFSWGLAQCKYGFEYDIISCKIAYIYISRNTFNTMKAQNSIIFFVILLVLAIIFFGALPEEKEWQRKK